MVGDGGVDVGGDHPDPVADPHGLAGRWREREVLVRHDQHLAAADQHRRAAVVESAMERLATAHALVGGDVVSAGSTVTYDLNRRATEIQAGSYVLMDSYFGPMAPAFGQGLFLELTVISVSRRYAVADGGLKCLGMDHGPPVLVGGP